MTINNFKTPITIGRFVIAPGDKVPDVPLSTKEKEAIAKLVSLNWFKVVETAKQPEPASEPAPEPASETPEPEKSAPKKSKTA